MYLIVPTPQRRVIGTGRWSDLGIHSHAGAWERSNPLADTRQEGILVVEGRCFVVVKWKPINNLLDIFICTE
jgi:hypothetical protein